MDILSIKIHSLRAFKISRPHSLRALTYPGPLISAPGGRIDIPSIRFVLLASIACFDPIVRGAPNFNVPDSLAPDELM